MNKQGTQFWVAIIGMAGLAAITGMAVAGSVWGNTPNDIVFMLIGGLLSVTSTAVAWLFRLNGKAQ